MGVSEGAGVGGRTRVELGTKVAVGGGVAVGWAVSVDATAVPISSTGVSLVKPEHEMMAQATRLEIMPKYRYFLTEFANIGFVPGVTVK